MSEILCDINSGGLLTTIQDLGRPGFRKFGVPISGALDQPSAMIANELVGNPVNHPLLEITQTGPQLKFRTYGALAITGAEMSPTLNGTPIFNNETFFFASGDILAFGRLQRGVRAYLAFAGELLAERLFSSTSTHIGNLWGGFKGRPIQSGNQLLFVPPEHKIRLNKVERGIHNPPFIRVLPSMEYEGLDATDKEKLFDREWVISSESNRTGIRLKGESLKSRLPEMISSPTDIGVMQLPPSGEPIILMNDSSSIGGYPRICAVIQEDIPVLAQKPPGSILQFKLAD